MIGGATKLFGLVGHPVAHARTPQAMNALFERNGLDAVMVPFDVPGTDLARCLASLSRVGNFQGMVVTVPHKMSAIALCRDLTPRARLAGAVNVMRRVGEDAFAGDMLDGEGFVVGLAAAGHSVAGRRICIVGAGGAASAIAVALAERQPAKLTLINRSRERLLALHERLRLRFPDLEVVIGEHVGGHDLVVNATSLGLREDDPLPFDPEQIGPGVLVAEVIMTPEITPILHAVARRGAAIHAGRAMLDGQLDAIFRYFSEGGRIAVRRGREA
ncbi:shikimate dehydrogenase family protein [Gluconacetobacter asukensis]|uniref:shikimate dehydrogenase (NADP(+)) n=1 Tax=Gluconacetobacter asukensis TaxID=1017181 RepID=A0A7W4NZV4_9PROT|nr:shikimate dehydrogenase [Gluconacetobacter asukensis]MBB2172302.1 shikimate dehydrogenase [Gluconacetobacter asukensis]